MRSSGLVETRPFGAGRSRTTLVTLTERGRDLLDAAQDRSLDDRQRFYAGFARRPEIAHDSHFHRAYERAAEKIRDSRWPRSPRRPRLRAEARLSALPAGAQSPEAGQRRQTRSHGRRGSRLGLGRTSCRTRTSTSSFPTCASSTRTGMVAARSRTSRSSRLTTAALMPPPRAVRASSNTARAVLGSVAAAGADVDDRSIHAWRRTSCRDRRRTHRRRRQARIHAAPGRLPGHGGDAFRRVPVTPLRHLFRACLGTGCPRLLRHAGEAALRDGLPVRPSGREPVPPSEQDHLSRDRRAGQPLASANRQWPVPSSG